MSLIKLLNINLNLHAANTNVTGDSGMTVQMKTYYERTLLENAKPKLVHNKFGQKKPIPKNGGKTIEFRKFTPLPKALTPLSEGVTPDGLKLESTNLTATVAQYGAYVTISDMLQMTAIDNNLQIASELLGDQAGETIDTITREVLNGGTTVQFSDGSKASRAALVGGNATYANNDYFDTETVRIAMLTLRVNKAKPVEAGKFVCILHPDQAFTLKKDTAWQEAHKYTDPKTIWEGSMGEYDGCIFYESTESKIFSAGFLTAAARTLTVASLATKTFTVDEAITAGEATALAARKIWIKDVCYTVASSAAGAAGAATITVTETVSGSPGDGDIVYPGDIVAGGTIMPDDGRDVASALFIGANAYGVTDVEGMGLETITHQVGSAGSADALNQRATHGWKTTHVAERLSELWMVRVETTIPNYRGAN